MKDRDGIFQKVSEFFSSERGKLIHFIRKRLHNSADRDAEDVLQDVMTVMLESLDPENPVENIAGYVYRSVRNRIIDIYRKPKRNVSLDEPVAGEEGETLADILSDMRYDTHTAVERMEMKQKLTKALDKLPPDQKAAVVETEIEGHTFEELSVLWGEPIGTLLARKHRGMKKLREYLKEYIV